MNQQQILAVLYDLSLAIGGELTVDALLGKTLQRLLFHTGFPIGAVLFDIARRDDAATVTLQLSIGSAALRKAEASRIAVPAHALTTVPSLRNCPELAAALTGSAASPWCLVLPIDTDRSIVLLATQPPATELPLTLVFQPVLNNLAKAIDLCAAHELQSRRVASDRDTAREALERELRLRNELLDALPNPVFIKDAQGRYLGCNRAFAEFNGVAESAILGKTVFDLWNADLAAIYADADAALMRQGGKQVYEAVVLRADGDAREVLFTKATFAQSDGSPAGLVGLMVDITERKRQEESLRLASLLYETSREGILIADLQSRILAVNPAFTAHTGYEAADVMGRTPAILKSGRQSRHFYEEMWAQLRATGRWSGEIWNKHKNGELIAEHLTITALRGADGAVQRYIGIFTNLTEDRAKDEQIWRHANFDTLTGLPNRRLFYDRLEIEAKSATRRGGSLALIFIDLDWFKNVNDTLGHAIGDRLLQQAAQRIQACVRNADITARLGGDEFTVIVSGYRDRSVVDRITQDILDGLRQPFDLGGGEVVHVSASIGITVYPDDAASIDELIRNADQAMYAAKAEGRNQSSYFTPVMQHEAKQKLALAADLRAAIEREALELFYQPIVSASSGRIEKAEALLRWTHPEHGPISPARFIPLAEETGLIHPIGAWVVRQAMRDHDWLRRSCGLEVQFSINVSPAQFLRHADRTWLRLLKGSTQPSGSFTVEITESLLMIDQPTIQEALLEFQREGIEVSIDDFGTGFSALSYLNQFDIDYLKIDRSFVSRIGQDRQSDGLVDAIIGIAHTLGIRTIAEGVETEAQRDHLVRSGCDYLQGFLFSPAVPLAEFAGLLTA